MSKEGNNKPYEMKQVHFSNFDSPLWKYRKNVTSQSGEDGIIAEIVRVLQKNSFISVDKTKGMEEMFCVEFGAADGMYYSNTHNLLHMNGWSGLLIEGDKESFKKCEERFVENPNVKCLNSFVSYEGEFSLDRIFLENNVPKNFELISIDVDGMDYFIWEALDEYHPKVVIVEFNPSVPNDIIFIQEKNSEVHQGSSLLAFIDLGKRKGYELVCATGGNAIFVRKEMYGCFNLKSNHINHLYRPKIDGRIWQGFDNTIFSTMNRMMWGGNCAISPEDLQVFPKSMRKYGAINRSE